MSNEITLTLPGERPFHPIAHLVLGGLAVRHDLTWEKLEDLQLVLAELLEQSDEDGEVTVCLDVAGDELSAAVGPFAAGALEHELDGNRNGGVGLARVLETIADRWEVVDRDGGRWIELTKRVR